MEDIILTVSKNLVIKDPSGEYTREHLANAVGYWTNFIKENDTGYPFGLLHAGGSTSFSSIAVLLALIDYGKDYVKLDSSDIIGSMKLAENNFGGFGKIFVVGYNVEIPKEEFRGSNRIVLADQFQTIDYGIPHSLEICFRESNSKYSFTSGTTGKKKLIKTSVGYDALSVIVAIDEYMHDDDYCVFSHDMAHVGVHSTAILPAVFGASVISLVGAKEWTKEIVNATHSQFFYTMVDKHPMPKCDKLKYVTTGGDFLKPKLIQHLLDAGVQEIIDIYGLTEASPPLAVRYVTDISKSIDPFDIINNHYSYELNEHDSTLTIVRPNGEKHGSGDIVRLDGNKLTYIGRLYDHVWVRVNGTQMFLSEFKQLFERETGVLNYFINYNGTDNPKINIILGDYSKTADFIKTFNAVLDIDVVDNVPTADGIKTTR